MIKMFFSKQIFKRYCCIQFSFQNKTLQWFNTFIVPLRTNF